MICDICGARGNEDEQPVPPGWYYRYLLTMGGVRSNTKATACSLECARNFWIQGPIHIEIDVVHDPVDVPISAPSPEPASMWQQLQADE